VRTAPGCPKTQLSAPVSVSENCGRVRTCAGGAGVIHMRQPKVGDLYLHRNRFNIPHSGGQHMLTYRAEPGSQSARALKELRTLSNTV
jgi:hypothetical protein